MIQVSNLSKYFGQTRAVDDVSFAVGKGEVVGFLGPNGAGKTTTIRVLTCFYPATSGSAKVAGFDVFQEAVQVRRNIGYLPENVPIYPDLRVQEYLSYRAALKGVPRKQRALAVEAAMERCGVLEVRRKLVGHVSRGYRQRVGLADALVASPPILILDEPTSGLDPNQRRKVKELVRSLADEHTVLFSSHILAEVEDVSTRVILIHQGKLRADGPPQQLVRQSRGQRLTVVAGMPAADLQACVAQVIGDCKAQLHEGQGYASLHVELSPEVDPRDAISAQLRQKDVPIRELRLDQPTLDEFFRQVTEDGS